MITHTSVWKNLKTTFFQLGPEMSCFKVGDKLLKICKKSFIKTELDKIQNGGKSNQEQMCKAYMDILYIYIHICSNIELNTALSTAQASLQSIMD